MIPYLAVADLHIGSIKDITYYYNTMTNIFERELLLDRKRVVFIAGDYFHRLFKANEEYTKLAINLMNYLVKICKRSRKNPLERTKVRIIYGTESHEMNQYHLFNYHINHPDIDFQIIDTVCREEIDGIEILYLPEEFMDDKFDHYDGYLYGDVKKGYDLIIGHGNIIEGMPMLSYDDKPKSNEKKVPIFKKGELTQFLNKDGRCLFGHYHDHTDMGDGVFYIGSTFRDSFGQEAPKGYMRFSKGEHSFIENTEAYLYKTYLYDENHEIYKSVDNIATELTRIKEEYPDIFAGERYGKIRLVFQTPTDLDVSFKENIRTLLYNDKVISPLIKEASIDVTAELGENAIDDEYEFVLDSSLGISDKIHRYMIRQYDSTMSLEELEAYINEPFKL